MSRCCTLAVASMLAFTGLSAAGSSDPFFVETELEARTLVGATTRIAPCTPLRMADDDKGRGKDARLDFGRVRTLIVKRRLLEAGERFSDFASCVATAAVYAGRTTDEQVAMIRDRNITVGMPFEFARVALGPFGTTIQGSRDSGRTAYRWFVGNACTPPTLQSASSVALEQVAPGSVIISASNDDRSIVDIQVPAPPGEVETVRAIFERGLTAFEAGDQSAALELWLPLAEGGFAPAQYAMADLYYGGDGVEKQLDLAARWFKKAAEGGYTPSMYHLAFLYAQGHGVERNLAEAYRWMQRAALLGDKKAETGLQMLRDHMTPEQIAESELSMQEQMIANPKLLDSTQPRYPELARVARLEANVILQAQIHADGTVGDLEVLRVNRPNMCFEEAAMAAVREWHYVPAMMGDVPIPVYFTIFVEFKLH